MTGWIRRASRARLVAAALATAAACGAAWVAVRELSGGPSPPAPAGIERVRQLVASAQRPAGMSARVSFTNNVLPGLDLGDGAAPESPLLGGGAGRLWWSPAGTRLELQSPAGDVQVLAGPSGLRLLDAQADTESQLPVALGGIVSALFDRFSAGGAWNPGPPRPAVVGGRPAYRVMLQPRDRSSLLAGVDVAVDAATGLPLEVAVLARGRSSPALSLSLHDVSLGAVDRSVIDVAAAARRDVPLGAALGFLGPIGSPRAVAGSGLSAVYAWRTASPGGLWDLLPRRTVDGASARELVSPLGTVLLLDRPGGTVALAGLVAPKVVEQAAARL